MSWYFLLSSVTSNDSGNMKVTDLSICIQYFFFAPPKKASHHCSRPYRTPVIKLTFAQHVELFDNWHCWRRGSERRPYKDRLSRTKGGRAVKLRYPRGFTMTCKNLTLFLEIDGIRWNSGTCNRIVTELVCWDVCVCFCCWICTYSIRPNFL